MTASPARRRNRTVLAALSGVVVLAAAPLMGYVGWHVLKDSKAGTAVAVTREIGFPSTPTGMIAIVDDQNVVTSLAVIVLAPGSGKGGTLVSLPTNASRAQSVDDAQVPVAQSLADGGVEGLQADVESLTRLSITFTEVLDRDQAAALFAPVGPIPVTLPGDVVDVSADGASESLFVAGKQDLATADAISVLLARDPKSAEIKRLPNVRAVWSGLAAAVGTGIAPDAVAAAAPVDAASFMTHFLAGPVQVFNDLDSEPITGSLNPDHLDVGSIDVPSMVLLMSSLAPSAMIIPLSTLTFRIENGVTQADIDAAGLEGITPSDVSRDMVARLLFLQGNVVSVSSVIYTPKTKTVPDTTLVFSNEGLQSDDLTAFTDALGTIEVDKPDFTFPLVNVVLVVGRSYLADMARIAAVTASTPTTVDTTTDSTPDSSATGDTTVGTGSLDSSDTVTS